MILSRIRIIPYTLIILAIVFVAFSFFPSAYEIYESRKIPNYREFVLEHNYMFDYNFYLSRILEGQEGRLLVVEKYYNKPHSGSLFQILYLYLGKIGGLLKLTPDWVYHISRLVFGFLLLLITGLWMRTLLRGWWSIVAFLFSVTAGSWPIPMIIGGHWRSATYMGWWSVIDSLQRITFIPHILVGQIAAILFIWRFTQGIPKIPYGVFVWGLIGCVAGIIFPPALFVVGATLFIVSILEVIDLVRSGQRVQVKRWAMNSVIPRVLFLILSAPSLIYTSLMFHIQPWKALSLFDILHRIPLPYREYALALGIMLPLGVLGLIVAFIGREKRLYPAVAWVISIFLLCLVFERVPQQSPLRFTEGAIHVPLGILAGYVFFRIWNIHGFGITLKRVIHVGIGALFTGTVVMGIVVMVSMIGWLTDQVQWKREGTWVVPIGAQVVYPLKTFMDGIRFIRDTVPKDQTVLSFVTAGNFIPAYAGNFVYIGHANTPDEDTKESEVAKFFSKSLTEEGARKLLSREHISYIFFGPQERDIAKGVNLETLYPYVTPVYTNPNVTIYKTVL
jgi:hypothetical protein